MNRNLRTFDTINRRGFTLIELLVVIAIIAILAGLTAWGVFAMIGNRQARNTEASIKTVSKLLKSHWNYVIEEADKDKDVSPAVALLAANTDGTPNPARARVLWRKVRLMEAFPQSFADVANPLVYKNNPFAPLTNGPPLIPQTGPGSPRRYIDKYNTGLSGYNVAAHKASTESSACLLLALSISRGSGATAINADLLGPAVADFDGDGVKEIVDGWGVPIGFFRFAWNQTPLQSANPASGSSASSAFADPEDNRGSLIHPLWYNMPNSAPNPFRQFYELNFHSVLAAGGPPRKAFYVVPVIVSSGGTPNVTPVPGLNSAPNNCLSIAQPASYIYSFNLQLD